jgi:hypothetical protein
LKSQIWKCLIEPLSFTVEPVVVTSRLAIVMFRLIAVTTELIVVTFRLITVTTELVVVTFRLIAVTTELIVAKTGQWRRQIHRHLWQQRSQRGKNWVIPLGVVAWFRGQSNARPLNRNEPQ